MQRNIQNFGGDPSKVTIFGESAGAISCSILCASPAQFVNELKEQITAIVNQVLADNSNRRVTLMPDLNR